MDNVENKEGAKAEAVKSAEGKTCCAMIGKKPWIIKVIAGALIVVVLGGGYYYSLQMKKLLTKEQAQAKVVEFIEKNMVAPGTKVEVVGVTKENGLYKVTIKVGEQEVPTYITQDGKNFFPQAIDIAEAEAKAQEQAKAAEIPKSDNPKADLYVMSFCPYGNKAEDTMKPVYDLLKDKVDFNFHYIVTTEGDKINSLHGAKEVAQNQREACVLKDSGKDKWFGFVSYVNAKCGVDGACWEAGARSLGLNTAKINACVASEGVALMKANEEASNLAGASGSPTLTINGVTSKVAYQYGNPEGYKQAICDAFNTAPEECAKVLASQATPAQAAAQGGSCN